MSLDFQVWDLADCGNMTSTFGGERAKGRARTQVVLDCAFSPNDRHTVASVGNERAVSNALCNIYYILLIYMLVL